MDRLLLGIDVGTSFVKAVVSTPQGRILARAQAEYPTAYPQPGWAEQAPEDWWQAVIQVTRQATAQVDGAICGMGVSGQGCAVTLIDRRGEVIRPAIIWLDTRSEAQSERLRQCCLADVLAQNGKSPASYNADPVLMWLVENEPGSIERAVTSLTTTGYINFRLTGRAVTNASDASILFAYSLEQQAWSPELIESFGVPARLYPPVAACAEGIGQLAPAAAVQLGLPGGIPVIAGGEDTSSAGLALGASQPGLAYLSLGTAGTIYVPISKLAVHTRLLTFQHVLSGQYLVGGSMAAFGATLAWCRKILGGEMDFDRLVALASASQPGAGRLIFLPYLSGELQPINDGYARGLLFGLSLSTGRADIVRAALEGTAYAIAHNLTILDSIGISVTEFRAVGGPTRSALWCQIIADVTGRPLRVMADEGGAPLGNAILAAYGIGLIDDPAQVALSAARIEKVYLPDETLFARYQAQFAIYRELYPQVKEQYRQLSNL